MTRKVITIFGGSGMIGRLIARRYAKKGYEVRVAVRRPNQALFVRTYGEVGQVVPLQANIRNEASVRAVMRGSDIVVNAVGILYETRFQKFDEVQGEGADTLARIAAEEHVGQFVQISAIGADVDARSKYLKSKAQGEENVRKYFPNALIVRPSVVFGGETDFFNKFAKLARWSWVMPVVKSKTKFQPVYADDVAEFVELALDGGHKGVFELGGDDVLSMREVVDYVCAASHRNRFVFGLPDFVAKIMAWVLSIVELLTLGIVKNRLITPDQIKSLAEDNVVTGENGLEKLGIVPEDFRPIEEPYMEAYRPSGEFDDMVKEAI